MQIGDDGGKGGRDDGLVQRGEEHPEHQGADDDQDSTVGQNRNIRLIGQFGGRSAHSVSPAFPVCGGRLVTAGCLPFGGRGA